VDLVSDIECTPSQSGIFPTIKEPCAKINVEGGSMSERRSPKARNQQ
jgi:hypothetical protein